MVLGLIAAVVVVAIVVSAMRSVIPSARGETRSGEGCLSAVLTSPTPTRRGRSSRPRRWPPR